MRCQTAKTPYQNRYVPIPVMLFGVFRGSRSPSSNRRHLIVVDLSHFHKPQDITVCRLANHGRLADHCLVVSATPFTTSRIDSTIHLSCQVATLIQPLGEAISYIAASWLLMLRVIALYKKKRRLVFLLYVLFATTHVVGFVLVVLIMVRIWR